MSALRHVADTTVQEINADTGQDFYGTLQRDRVRLEREFQAAHQTLVAQQKQTLKHLQKFCTEVIDKQLKPQSKSSLAWSEEDLSLPGSAIVKARDVPEVIKMEKLSSQTKNGLLRPPVPPNGATRTSVESLEDDVEEITWSDEEPLAARGRAHSATELAPDMLRTSKNGFVAKYAFKGGVEDAQVKKLSLNSGATYTNAYSENGEGAIGKPKLSHMARFAAAQQLADEHKLREARSTNKSYGNTFNPLRRTAVFADAEAMKAKVKENIMRPEYNVAQYYKTTGCAQALARSPGFDNLTLLVIALNAVWIGIDTDYNDSPTLLDAHPVFIVGENAFCVYFAVEVFIRFLAFEVKRNGLRDGWFVFDSSLVFMMVLETWLFNLAIWLFGGGSGAELGNASLLRLVRLLRLTRMARMMRLLRATPELMILVKGISVAARSVIFTLLLLILILYVFAIAFRQMCAETILEDSHFKSVPEAMVTLLMDGVLPDQGELVRSLGDQNYAYGAVVLIFILLSSLTIMNMLVGVLCEVISVVSAVEKEQMQLSFVKNKILELIQEHEIDIDEADDYRISREEFEHLLLEPKGARAIQEVGVDVVVLIDLMDHLWGQHDKLSVADLLELVLSLRGSNTATVRDVVDLRKFVTQMSIDSHELLVEKVTHLFTSCSVDRKSISGNRVWGSKPPESKPWD